MLKPPHVVPVRVRIDRGAVSVSVMREIRHCLALVSCVMSIWFADLEYHFAVRFDAFGFWGNPRDGRVCVAGEFMLEAMTFSTARI